MDRVQSLEKGQPNFPVRFLILTQTVRQSTAVVCTAVVSTDGSSGTKMISVSLQIDIFGIVVEFYGPCAILGKGATELPGAILNIGPNGTPVYGSGVHGRGVDRRGWRPGMASSPLLMSLFGIVVEFSKR
jgi:hypothetical protein